MLCRIFTKADIFVEIIMEYFRNCGKCQIIDGNQSANISWARIFPEKLKYFGNFLAVKFGSR